MATQNHPFTVSLPKNKVHTMQHYTAQVMWAQIDGNMHLRHSAYADFAAQARMFELEKLGITAEGFLIEKLGPILFREETIYLKEVKPNDTVTVKVALTKCLPDASRWTIRHEIFRSDGKLAAEVIVDGAWLSMETRKLAIPPKTIADNFRLLPAE